METSTGPRDSYHDDGFTREGGGVARSGVGQSRSGGLGGDYGAERGIRARDGLSRGEGATAARGSGYPVERGSRGSADDRPGSSTAVYDRTAAEGRYPNRAEGGTAGGAPVEQSGQFDLYTSIVTVFQEISKNREGIRAAISRLEATWTAVSPMLDAAGLTAMKVLVSMSITALRQLSEGLIAMADALQVFLASHQGVVDVLKRLSEQFSPQLQAFVEDEVVGSMRTRKAGLKGATVDQYNKQADTQADAMVTLSEASTQLTRGLSNLAKAHSALMVGFGAATGGAALGIAGGTAVLTPPATPAAPAVYMSVIAATVSQIGALGSAYVSARDDILGGIQKICDVPTLASGQWPKSTGDSGTAASATARRSSGSVERAAGASATARRSSGSVERAAGASATARRSSGSVRQTAGASNAR